MGDMIKLFISSIVGAIGTTIARMCFWKFDHN